MSPFIFLTVFWVMMKCFVGKGVYIIIIGCRQPGTTPLWVISVGEGSGNLKSD